MISRKTSLSFLAFALIAFGLFLLWPNGSSPTVFEAAGSDSRETVVNVNGRSFVVEIAKTDDEKIDGLSNHDSLPTGRGMLFVFNPPERPTFWMREMRFAIDIVWIANGRVIGIERRVAPEPGVPEGQLTLYPAPDVVDYVLEINAGEADGLSIGDEVKISFATAI